MKNEFILVLGVMVFCLFSGCMVPKCTLTTARIKQPVLVGKVKTIGGKPIENSNLQKDTLFNAKIGNSMLYFYTKYWDDEIVTNQESFFLDMQLMPYTHDTSSMLIVDRVRFKIFDGNWLIIRYSVIIGWLEGAKYNYICESRVEKKLRKSFIWPQS